MNKLLTLGLSLENVIHDYKIVADSVVDDKTYQNSDVGILLSNLDDVVKWLEELRDLQEQNNDYRCKIFDLADHDKQIRDEVINEFVERVEKENINIYEQPINCVRKVAMQMKGEQNE